MKSWVLDLLRDPVDGSRLILEKTPGDPEEGRFPSLGSPSGRRYPIVRSVPLTLQRLFPVSTHEDPEWRVLDTLDWYSTKYLWTHSDEEVESWFREADFSDVWHGSFPVSVRGTKT